MIGLKNFFLLTFLCLPLVSHADCEKWISHWLNLRHHSLDSDMAVCKVWPADKSKTIVVLPLKHENGENDIYDLDVLLIDSKSGKLIANSWQPNALESDAVKLSDFEIDTARYQLNPETLAFGLRISYRLRSQVNPYYIDYINLYVKQNDELKLVVNMLPIAKFAGLTESFKCIGKFSFYDRYIILGNKMTNGYINLIVSEKPGKDIEKVDRSGECNTLTKNLPKKKYNLYYNGLEYPVKKIEE